MERREEIGVKTKDYYLSEWGPDWPCAESLIGDVVRVGLLVSSESSYKFR